jgi:transcriptional regulator with XRE-family HTH domain
VNDELPSGDLGRRLLTLRAHLGVSQRRMSLATGGKPRSWQNYESNRSVPGGRVIAHLANLGFNTNWVLTGKGSLLTAETPAEVADLRRLRTENASLKAELVRLVLATEHQTSPLSMCRCATEPRELGQPTPINVAPSVGEHP